MMMMMMMMIINGKGHAIPHIMQGQAFLSQELGPVIKKNQRN